MKRWPILLPILLASGGCAPEVGEGEAARPEAVQPLSGSDSALLRRMPLPVVEYLAECGAESLSPDPAALPPHAATCARAIGDAVSALAELHAEETQLIRWQVEALRATQPEALSASLLQEQRWTRDLLISATALLSQFYELRYSLDPVTTQEIAQARRAARDLDPAIPLDGQRELLGEVFLHAGNALRRMAEIELDA